MPLDDFEVLVELLGDVIAPDIVQSNIEDATSQYTLKW
jgi:hypothetical protein